MELVLFVLAIVVVLVLMAQRAKSRKTEPFRTFDGQPQRPWEGPKPQLLSKAQRKALNLNLSQTSKPTVAIGDQGSHPSIDNALGDDRARHQTRAIRQGWRLGRVQFTYEDVDGDISFRTVTVHHVTRFYLKGECHSRRAERTFRLDRVIGTLTDCDTGEIFTPEECSSRFGR
ncbi:WYL domain-containing protein [Pseudomonas aeruginosa]|uniref:WYL domain-containing protein n=1 Tax=Pseudomonas aeruginosa TaxID=287 RepID=UPI0012986C1C|nr:WYL domain-containing protein [Pseudomonas aeruginosa]EME0887375.1 WYL domain-containing protein [Pseudomonas aeruginosa]HBN8067186.1 WYL domain-containing protein [Pseudomonas aeruginosa]HBN8081511.1 WYL domain-containing protein [Pseudomonas aeruginosa]HBN8177824.1 WYL domain-containing protein [Pseudomonas aeruginosa]HBN8294007.1 WYL domain-containing protein [Pseudomonas aeruginosa]